MKIEPSPLQINSIAGQIFDQLALRFPVCMASDEFHFFPQARAAEHDWSRWDDFSSESIQAVSGQLSQWNHDLDRCKTAGLSVEQRIDTGFFSGPIDYMLLAKRRFWRAIRGRVDLDIHTRKRSLAEAASFLVDYGMDTSNALAMVRRYVLKPGYQLAYTLGRGHFRRLYDKFNAKYQNPVKFAHKVLAQGEIDFDNLEPQLSEKRLNRGVIS